MKKILVILMSLTIMVGLVACTKNQNAMIEPDLSNTIYKAIDWDELEVRPDVEFKMFGVSDAPFKLTDFQHLVKEFVSNCSDVEGNNRVLIEDFSTFVNGDQYVEPHLVFTNSNAQIDMNTGASFNFNITSDENSARVTSVSNALENSEYFYWTRGEYIAEMLEVSVKDKSNPKVVLDGILNKFGKPTYVEITRDDVYDFGDCPERLFWYDLIYELSDSVLKISVYETVSTSKDKDVDNDIYMYAFVYTDVSYQKCR